MTVAVEQLRRTLRITGGCATERDVARAEATLDSLVGALEALPHHPNCASFSMGGWPEDGASFCDCPKKVAA